MRPSLFTASLLSLVCCPTAAIASALEITDLPVASNVEFGIGLELDDSAGEAGSRHYFADLAVPLSNQAEVSIRTGMERQYSAGEPYQHTFAGAQVAVKYELLREGPGRIGATVEPAIILPGTGNEFGFGEAHVVVPIVVGLTLDRWQFRSLLGIERAVGGGEGKLHAGIAAERSVTDNLLIGAEALSNFAINSLDEREFFFNVGIVFSPTNRTEFHFRLGNKMFGYSDESKTKALAKVIIRL